jgi:hypothetical protein
MRRMHRQLFTRTDAAPQHAPSREKKHAYRATLRVSSAECNVPEKERDDKILCSLFPGFRINNCFWSFTQDVSTAADAPTGVRTDNFSIAPLQEERRTHIVRLH